MRSTEFPQKDHLERRGCKRRGRTKRKKEKRRPEKIPLRRWKRKQQKKKYVHVPFTSRLLIRPNARCNAHCGTDVRIDGGVSTQARPLPVPQFNRSQLDPLATPTSFRIFLVVVARGYISFFPRCPLRLIGAPHTHAHTPPFWGYRRKHHQ